MYSTQRLFGDSRDTFGVVARYLNQHGGSMMPGVKSPQLQALVVTCRRLSAARQRVLELEEQRDRLISELRAAGITGSLLAERTGLTPGRIAQISNEGAARSSG